MPHTSIFFREEEVNSLTRIWLGKSYEGTLVGKSDHQINDSAKGYFI